MAWRIAVATYGYIYVVIYVHGCHFRSSKVIHSFWLSLPLGCLGMNNRMPLPTLGSPGGHP